MPSDRSLDAVVAERWNMIRESLEDHLCESGDIESRCYAKMIAGNECSLRIALAALRALGVKVGEEG